MDNLTKEQRYKNMQAIKSKDSSIELKLRKKLWNCGIRYRKNYIKLIGKPDIVLTKYKIAIFCDSDFWHGRDINKIKNQVKSNQEYWIPKIEKNIEHDKVVNDSLFAEGWLVLRFWETDIKNDVDSCVNIIIQHLPSGFIRKDILR